MDHARQKMLVALSWSLLMPAAYTQALQSSPLEAEVRKRAAAVEQKVIAWRRDIHQHPELGDQEKRTAGLVAEHLRGLKMDVRTGIAWTGVVGILKGGQPGPTVALRADMDALPVTEPAGLPFTSKAKGTYEGQQVDLMHACGHDAHTAMLMGVAEVLAGMREQTSRNRDVPVPTGGGGIEPVPGNGGKELGRQADARKKACSNRRSPTRFSQYTSCPVLPGRFRTRPAQSPRAATSWESVSRVSRGTVGCPGTRSTRSRRRQRSSRVCRRSSAGEPTLTTSPAVITIGTIRGGSRANIVPDFVEMAGTIRTYDEAIREQIGRDIQMTVQKIAESAGAKAEVTITKMYATTVNDEALTTRMLPVLERAADGRVARALLSGSIGGLLLLRSTSSGIVSLSGNHPTRSGPCESRAQPQPAVLC